MEWSIKEHEDEAFDSDEKIERDRMYDLVIVGAGPSGLAAAANASSLGLSVLMIEAVALGGNAASAAESLRKSELTGPRSDVHVLDRLYEQVRISSVPLLMDREVMKIACSHGLHRLKMNDGKTIHSRSIVIATGARYGRLQVPNYARFEHQGIHYAATGMEAAFCLGEDVVVVGAGNSAGKAAVFLSGTAHHVHLVTRNEALGEGMSHYLLERILHSPHITLHTSTEIESLAGDSTLREVTWKHIHSCVRETHAIGSLFVMIGPKPQSEWLHGHLELDEHGFVRTGFTHMQMDNSRFSTSCAGVFAIGDVRSGSVKRVVSAVEEGTVVATELRRYLVAGVRP